MFALRPGQASRAIFVDSGDETTTGYHFYRVNERGERELDPSQQALIRDTAFTDWYQEETTKAEDEGRITRDPDVFTPSTDSDLDQPIQ